MVSAQVLFDDQCVAYWSVCPCDKGQQVESTLIYEYYDSVFLPFFDLGPLLILPTFDGIFNSLGSPTKRLLERAVNTPEYPPDMSRVI